MDSSNVKFRVSHDFSFDNSMDSKWSDSNDTSLTWRVFFDSLKKPPITTPAKVKI